jgi:hypothetical protein
MPCSFTCSCGFSSTLPEDIKSHLKSCRTLYTCATCGRSDLGNSYNLQVHERRCAREEELKIAKEAELKAVADLRCEVCKRGGFSSEFQLRVHESKCLAERNKRREQYRRELAELEGR